MIDRPVRTIIHMGITSRLTTRVRTTMRGAVVVVVVELVVVVSSTVVAVVVAVVTRGLAVAVGRRTVVGGAVAGGAVGGAVLGGLVEGGDGNDGGDGGGGAVSSWPPDAGDMTQTDAATASTPTAALYRHRTDCHPPGAGAGAVIGDFHFTARDGGRRLSPRRAGNRPERPGIPA